MLINSNQITASITSSITSYSGMFISFVVSTSQVI